MSGEEFDLDPGNIDLGDYDTYGDDCGAPGIIEPGLKMILGDEGPFTMKR